MGFGKSLKKPFKFRKKTFGNMPGKKLLKGLKGRGGGDDDRGEAADLRMIEEPTTRQAGAGQVKYNEQKWV